MFVLNREYARSDLLTFVGSKQPVSGILWGTREPGAVILTSGGNNSKQRGYEDQRQDDGTWIYHGQGESGDQDPDSYANRLLIGGERTVLLFETRGPSAAEVRAQGHYRNLYRFVGDFHVAGYETRIPDAGRRKGQKLLCFQLVPVCEHPAVFVEQIEPPDGEGALSLREKILASPIVAPDCRVTSAVYRLRSERVRRYALFRADGKCEYCAQPAPFHMDAGEPFLEVHHIFRLSDDGPDLPSNVAALCPNCHRAVHYAHDRIQRNNHLAALISALESKLPKGH
jgi:5-methylcytosine-specific restriction enzyme A